VQSENEFATTAQAHIPGLNEHMQDIINVLREGGITKVPTIHNDKNPSGQYAMPGLGKVDLCVFVFLLLAPFSTFDFRPAALRSRCFTHFSFTLTSFVCIVANRSAGTAGTGAHLFVRFLEVDVTFSDYDA
jgi:hypothetical protein